MRRFGYLAAVIGLALAIAPPFFLQPYGIYLLSLWAVTTIAVSWLVLPESSTTMSPAARGAVTLISVCPAVAGAERVVAAGVET